MIETLYNIQLALILLFCALTIFGITSEIRFERKEKERKKEAQKNKIAQ